MTTNRRNLIGAGLSAFLGATDREKSRAGSSARLWSALWRLVDSNSPGERMTLFGHPELAKNLSPSALAVATRSQCKETAAEGDPSFLRMSPENDSPGEDTAFRRTIQEDSRDTYVIDAEALLRMTHAAEQLLLLDVSPLRAYRSAHIPGAVHVFWEDTVDREYPYFGAVVTQGNDQEQRIGFVRKLGLNENMHVVAYDNQMGYRAARLVWYLRFLGFSQVSLLDGGLSAWRIQGQSVQSGVNTIDETDTSVDPQDGYYVVTRQLLDRMATQSPLIVDTRTDEERSNDLDGVIPLGTIPGSVRFPWRSMIDSASAKLRNADQLLQELEQAGIGADRDVVVFGLFGVDTALPWLVLKHLGFPDVATYDRGWVEWASRPDLEKAPL